MFTFGRARYKETERERIRDPRKLAIVEAIIDAVHDVVEGAGPVERALEVKVRGKAAVAASECRSPRTLALLESRLRSEGDAGVLASLELALARLRERGSTASAGHTTASSPRKWLSVLAGRIRRR